MSKFASFVRKYLNHPQVFRHVLNIYPPYVGAGIHVTHIANDFTSVNVEMRSRWYTTNYLGTAFGGSLYSMIDPFFVLLTMNRLGSNYIVWDKEATITFLQPGRGAKVKARFDVTQDDIDNIKEYTKNGMKYHPIFTVNITDETGEIIIAKAKKTLYVRQKQRRVPS